MKKLSIFIFFLFCFCHVNYSQTYQALDPNLARILKNRTPLHKSSKPLKFKVQDTLDTSLLDCIYYYVKYDPVSDLKLDEDEILLIGKDISMYSNYDKWRSDSLGQTYAVKGKTMPFYEYTNLTEDWIPRHSFTLRNHEKGDSLYVYDSIVTDKYTYSEPNPDLKWELGDEVKKIGPYECLKATTTFRGRDWTAWYTEEIPFSEGPWKFSGLPGLIVQIQDSKGEHTFSLSRVRDIKSKMYFDSKRKYFKTQRLKFNKLKKNYEANPLGALENSGVTVTDGSGNAMRPKEGVKRFVNFIELE